MDQLRTLLSGLSLKQKISILLAAVLTAGGIFAFVNWKREGDFRPLYTSMALEDASVVVQKLRETGVEYRLSENGSSVLVPSAKLAESRLALAAAGLPKTGRIGFELFDKTSFGATEFVEHINYKRALEGELERSAMSLAEVEQARIHLTLPKETVFLEQQQPAKASVMLKLRPGAQISPQNVLAVTHLVASAVEGLSPEAVSVLDMNGNLLSRPRRPSSPDGSQLTAESLEVRQQLERDLVTKINATLEPLLGPEKFRAGAAVECDLTSGEQQEETFDPNRSVMVTSQKTEDVTERASSSSGVPGTASNLPRPVSRTGGSGGVSRRTENVTYQTTRVVRHTRIPQGVVKRMSLSVLVDQDVRWEGSGTARKRVLTPPPPETMKTIKDLVAGATGFSAERGDVLIVETLPFESSLTSEPPVGRGGPSAPLDKPGPAWLQFVSKYRDMVPPIALGAVVIVLLFGGVVKLLGRRKRFSAVSMPDELPSGGQAPARQLPADLLDNRPTVAAIASGGVQGAFGAEIADRVRELAQRDPAITANVVRMWLQDSRA